MKVLMFGWEFPPKIYGGLAVASYGITKGLSLQGDVQTTFCLPKPTGEEEKFLNIINMSQVPVVWREPEYENLCSRLVGHNSGDYYRFRNHIYADFNYLQGLDDLGCIGFAGGYPSNLHEEINNFSIISGVLARSEDFDLIHAHDWLTYPAGVHAKMVSGKPLCIHVHATDFDRSRGKVNPTVYSIEKNGMDHADCIMCVSELTRQTVIHQYHQDPRKCVAMHNAVYPLSEEIRAIEPHKNPDEKVVTFLGRITMQKGPEYFIEAAKRVLDRSRNIRFCFAGSGDMLNAMIELAAAYGIADRCHFPGFQRGKQVYECYKNSDVFVMPSVSEPFGIAPLEAMQCGCPSIISKQSGCGEILTNVIKVDYWDIDAMADAIYSICTNDALYKYLSEEGLREVDQITWEKVGLRIRSCYDQLTGRGWFDV
ncbi:MAG: glycosyltransferase family 4 protein, partial [Bacteroidaceae bacterium]|nr:glycosyltransferase family 4 protein [Bacteroidaceae bacterium]